MEEESGTIKQNYNAKGNKRKFQGNKKKYYNENPSECMQHNLDYVESINFRINYFFLYIIYQTIDSLNRRSEYFITHIR